MSRRSSKKILILEEDGKFATAARLADDWRCCKLKSKAETDKGGSARSTSSSTYHTAYSFYRYGQTMREKDKAKGDKSVKEAATQLVQLEKTWKGFGSEASTRHPRPALDKEPDLKAYYEVLKNK